MAERQEDIIEKAKEDFLRETHMYIVGVGTFKKRWAGFRSPKHNLYEVLHLTPKPDVNQKEHTLQEVVKYFPKAAVYIYGDEGVVRFAVHENTIAISLLARDGLFGHIVPATDMQIPLNLNRIIYTLGQPFEVPYTLVEGGNKVFSISEVKGILLQRNHSVAAGVGEINYLQTVPPHESFYQPPKL